MIHMFNVYFFRFRKKMFAVVSGLHELAPSPLKILKLNLMNLNYNFFEQDSGGSCSHYDIFDSYINLNKLELNTRKITIKMNNTLERIIKIIIYVYLALGLSKKERG